MNRALSRFAASLALATMLAASPVLAEPTMADKSESHTLFERGLGEYKKSSYAEALKLFLASQELDPGVGTLLYMGECYKQLGKAASAWGAFKEAATLAQRLGDKRGETATSKAAEVDTLRSYLTIEVPAAARVNGLQVKRDGKPVPTALWGTSVPVDPGTYTIELSAPGRLAEKSSVPVGDKASKITHTVTALKAAPVVPEVVAAPPPTPRKDPPAPPPSPATEEGSTSSPWRTVGIVGAGVGLAVTVVGGVLMKGASTKADDARGAGDVPAYNDAKSSYSTGTFVLIGGAALVVGGIAVAIINPGAASSPRTAWVVSPTIAPGLAGLSFGGAY